MDNIHSIDEQRQLKQDPQSTEILDAACDWVSKLDRDLTETEKESFEKWMVSSPENMKVLFKVAKVWDKMGKLNRLSSLFPHNLASQHAASQKSHTKRWAFALAASICITFITTFYMKSVNDSQLAIDNLQKTLSTNIGDISTTFLPDGSKVVLNTNTLVNIRYTANARIIELKQGEVHIDVAHNKSRPLSVIAAGKIIQAVGTAFNVEMLNDSVELIVTDGRVLAAAIEPHLPLTDIEEFAATLPVNSIAIAKGEKISLAYSGQAEKKIFEITPIDIEADLSWQQGNLIFQGETLAEVITEISRYTDIEFDLGDDEKLKNIQVAGMFKTNDVSGLLAVLKESFNVDNQRVNSKKVVFRLSETGEIDKETF